MTSLAVAYIGHFCWLGGAISYYTVTFSNTTSVVSLRSIVNCGRDVTMIIVIGEVNVL